MFCRVNSEAFSQDKRDTQVADSFFGQRVLLDIQVKALSSQTSPFFVVVAKLNP